MRISELAIHPLKSARRLPVQARFDANLPEQKGARICLANPDAPEGYAYYKAEVTALLKLYPQIDRLAFWIRAGGTPWQRMLCVPIDDGYIHVISPDRLGAQTPACVNAFVSRAPCEAN